MLSAQGFSEACILAQSCNFLKNKKWSIYLYFLSSYVQSFNLFTQLLLPLQNCRVLQKVFIPELTFLLSIVLIRGRVQCFHDPETGICVPNTGGQRGITNTCLLCSSPESPFKQQSLFPIYLRGTVSLKAPLGPDDTVMVSIRVASCGLLCWYEVVEGSVFRLRFPDTALSFEAPQYTLPLKWLLTYLCSLFHVLL